jgi:UDP-N-acetylmuramate--alanine ligase
MGKELVDTFASQLHADDLLVMPDPAYYGGTTNREITSQHIVRGISERGRQAIYEENRKDCLPILARHARPGDRIVIMGARDDTLSEFAIDVLKAVS